MRCVLEEGVFLYRGGRPERASGKLPTPGEAGGLLIYFDNRKCPFCRKFDPLWEELAHSLGPGDPLPLRVVCTFFAQDCGDPLARRLFEEYGVSVSPLLLYLSPSGATRRVSPPLLWSLGMGGLLRLVRTLRHTLP